MNDKDMALVELVKRTKDSGDGWKQVSDTLWLGVQIVAQRREDLFMLDKENKRIKLVKE